MTWRVTAEMRLGALDLDVDVRGSEGPLALVGPNGSGKTTLLRVIAGVHRPDSGRIELGGACVFDSDQRVDRPPEDRHVAYVPQGYGLFPHLNVIENVAFAWTARRSRLPKAERHGRATELLDRVGCAHLSSRMPTSLSGGEQQRVALARALAMSPQILLLDEPLAALDAPARRTMRVFLGEHMAKGGSPTVVVTHDARDIVEWNARVCVLEAGRVVQQGSAAEVAARPATEFVSAFFDV